MSRYIFCLCLSLFAVDVRRAAGVEGLQDALFNLITDSGRTAEIDFQANIILNGELGSLTSISNPVLLPIGISPAFNSVASNITIEGSSREGNFALDGNNSFRGFFVYGGSITFSNLVFRNLVAQGGISRFGGSGLGAGGGLFVGSEADVTLINATFRNCQAIGGVTDAMGGSGGASINLPTENSLQTTATGGHGFAGFARGPLGGGSAQNAIYNADNPINSTQGGDFGGMASAGIGYATQNMAGGGGATGAGGGRGIPGGNGGAFGGGGSSIERAGNGGFGGGGGASSTGQGGQGGFGAGGGSGRTANGRGGFGGTAGSYSTDDSERHGGNGAAFGGAIFIQEGGMLTISGVTTFENNMVVAGSDVNATALALGDDIFMMSGALLTFNATADIIIPSPIAGNRGNRAGITTAFNLFGFPGGIIKNGSGLLSLRGDNSYSGTTTINNGTLTVVPVNDMASLLSNVIVAMGTLQVDDILNINQLMLVAGSIASDGNLSVSGGSVTVGSDATLMVENIATVSMGLLTIAEGGLLSTRDLTLTGGSLELGLRASVEVLNDFNQNSGTLVLTVDPETLTTNQIVITDMALFNGSLALNIAPEIDLLRPANRSFLLNFVDANDPPNYIASFSDVTVANSDAIGLEAMFTIAQNSANRYAVTVTPTKVQVNSNVTAVNDVDFDINIVNSLTLGPNITIMGDIDIQRDATLNFIGDNDAVSAETICANDGSTVSFILPDDIRNVSAQNVAINFEAGSTLRIIFPSLNIFPAGNIVLFNGDIRIGTRAVNSSDIIFSSNASGNMADAIYSSFMVAIDGLDRFAQERFSFDILGGSLTLRINENFFDPIDIDSRVAQDIAVAIFNGNFDSATALLFGDDSAVTNEILYSLSPGTYATIGWIHARHMSATFAYISDQIQNILFNHKSPWLAFYSITNRQYGELDELFPFDSAGGAALLGKDYLSDNILWGISCADIFSSIAWHEYGQGKINSFLGALYGAYYTKDTNLEAILLFGYSWEKLSREAFTVGEPNKIYAQAGPRARFFSCHLKSSTTIPTLLGKQSRGGQLRTILSFLIDYHFIHNEKVEEANGRYSNDAYGLKIDAHNLSLLRFEGGFKFEAAKIYCLVPYLSCNLIAELAHNSGKAVVSLQDSPSFRFPLNYFGSTLWNVAPEIGFVLRTKRANILFSYKGLYNYAGSVHQVAMAVNFAF